MGTRASAIAPHDPRLFDPLPPDGDNLILAELVLQASTRSQAYKDPRIFSRGSL